MRKRDDPDDVHTNDIFIHKLHENMVKLRTVQVGGVINYSFCALWLEGSFQRTLETAKTVHMSFTDISATFKKVTGDSSYDKSTSSPFSFLFNNIAYRQ